MALKFLGPRAPQRVAKFMATIKEIPEQFDWVTAFQVQCLSDNEKYHPTGPATPLPTLSDTTILSNCTGTTAAEPDLVSPFEATHFFTGISHDPPALLQRSDLTLRPFVIPSGRHSTIPEKKVHGLVHKVLSNQFWKEIVAPDIILVLKDKSRGIRVSTMVPVRFSTCDRDGKDVLDDYVVLWISVYPGTTKETACRDTNTDILAILAKHGIQDAAVYWIEGKVQRLVGPPPMMPVVRDTNPTHWIRRALTALVGIPLAADQLADQDAQGTLGLYFHEGKDRHGNKSKRVMAVTNKHVVSNNTTTDYQYSGRPGAPKQLIRNCNGRRFQKIVDETRAMVATKLDDAKFFAEQIAELAAKLGAPDYDEEDAVDDDKDKQRKEADFERAKYDVKTLDDFLKLLNSTWSDNLQRIAGYVDWAPKIAKDVDHHCYTRDIGVMALEEDKFMPSFKGNHVYLAGKYTRAEINTFFYPNAANSLVFNYPKNHLFPLLGWVDTAGLANSYVMDDQGNPCFIVAKHGQTTDLTFGRYSELESYHCDEFEHDSWEVAVFNYDKKSGNFSDHGDSGSIIFNAEGKIVALLHSNMPKGLYSHVTYGAPGHFVFDQIKEHYPDADFACLSFDA
ncbi:hypothetical protein D9615_009391 [Tricholomella constricta]|uniref:Uncharacterized protein n=1 Tax=Tricholomella constricta TaxID=117010 RepID=A0A8H5H2B0_9AGAR|nr:hypothetical protein D9615_009391 [Tricholomella constricta]